MSIYNNGNLILLTLTITTINGYTKLVDVDQLSCNNIRNVLLTAGQFA